jgi:hypothetical protein
MERVFFMYKFYSRRFGSRFVRASIALLLGALLWQSSSAADGTQIYDPGLYLGGSVGQSLVEANVAPSAFESQDFRQHDTGYKAMLGIRPIPYLGAELDYIDLGVADGGVWGATGFTPADVRMLGGAGFGMVYVPTPLPTLDFFGKLGVSRFQSRVESAGYPACGFGCGFNNYDVYTTGIAWGAGGQFRFGRIAIRGEFERFNASGGHPSLASVGATWTFW